MTTCTGPQALLTPRGMAPKTKPYDASKVRVIAGSRPSSGPVGRGFFVCRCRGSRFTIAPMVSWTCA
jgi:hypothetical protein